MGEVFVAQYDDQIKEPDKKEVKKEVKIEVTPEPETKTEPVKLTRQEREEAKARSSGWAPESEWQGNQDDWVSAEVFNARGPLFETMKQQKQRIERLERETQTMGGLVKKTRDDERKKVLEELQKQKGASMEAGEYAKVIELDGKIEEAKKPDPAVEHKTTETITPEQEAVKVKLEKFLNDNQWYKTDKRMRFYMDATGGDYMAEHPSANADQILEHALSETRKMFPDKFGATQPRSPVGEGGVFVPQKRGDKKLTRKDLDDEHRDILRRFVAADNTGRPDSEVEAEMIAEWQAIGEIS